MVDMVNNPPHYEARNGMESMDWLLTSMTEDEKRGYLKGNVLKYLWRYEHKGKPVEDLKKAAWYLNKLREIVEADSRIYVKVDSEGISLETAKAIKDMFIGR